MSTQVNKPANMRLIIILLVATGILLTPLVAMQFTHEVKWELFDFIIAGILLFGTGLTCELVIRNVRNFQNRVLICAGILLALFLIWAELAVGVFGTPFAGS